ncbi:hypothetical protein SEA_DMITRI_35 [Gordonia phage Dmitri]|nr:hypothetical protein SEA_DMITRI_35 [Gordonia phage Dmitri]
MCDGTNVDYWHIEEHSAGGSDDPDDDLLPPGLVGIEMGLEARSSISDGKTTFEVERILSGPPGPLVVLSAGRPPFFDWEELPHWDIPDPPKW